MLLEGMDCQDYMDYGDIEVLQDVRDPTAGREVAEIWEHQDEEETLELKEEEDLMEVLVKKVHQEVLDYKVNEDPMVTWEDLANLGRKEEPEQMAQ